MSLSPKDFEAFASEYKTEEQEILVLFSDASGGASKAETLWSAIAYFLAYVDTRTGAVKKGEGRVVWPVTDEDRKEHGCAYPHFFKEGGIYRLRVRDLIDRTVPEGHLPSAYNCFLVVKVLEENVQNDALTAILEAYRKPVVLKDKELGTFTLNKDLAMFEGKIKWRGRKIPVFLEVDREDDTHWTLARDHLRTLYANQEHQDAEFRRFAAEKLTALANDWREDEAVPEITPEAFAKRITLSELAVTQNGNYTAYYADDDLFAGHVVTVHGNTERGMKDAGIEG